jgi:hypothetical protein
MTYVLIIGGIILAWAFLRVVAGEREQQVRDLTWKIAHTPAPESTHHRGSSSSS